MPVQSVAPVRKSFLDNYPGDIIFIQCWVPVWPLEGKHVWQAAERFNHIIKPEDAWVWADKINRVATARKLVTKVRRIEPMPEPLPPFAEALVEWQRETTDAWRRRFDYEYMNPAVFRGYKFEDLSGWWQIFFYRFVDPHQRIGSNLNYNDRLRRADARILPTLWTIYTSPGTDRSDQASLEETK